MNGSHNFSDQEWADITVVPLKVAIMASLADRGLIAHKREQDAYPVAVTRALEKYKDNELITSVLCKEEGDAEMQLQEEADSRGGEEAFMVQLKESVGAVVSLVRAKSAAADAELFCRMLHEIAVEIAGASGEGFLGSGPKISPKEAAFLEELKGILKQ